MRKICYEVNPERFAADMERFSLSFIEISVYRGLLDVLWNSKKQYKVEDDRESISALIGCDKDILDIVVNKLTSTDFPLLKSEMDLTDLDFYISSVELKKQKNSFLDQKSIEREIIVPLRKENGSRLPTLVDKIREAESGTQTATTKYLKKSEREPDEYCGWLPTRNFDSNGQVFVLSKELLDNISKEFPEKDIEFHIDSIFKWMMKNSTKRTTIANMNNFIFGWLERTDSDGNPDMSFDEMLAKATESINDEEESEEEF